MKLNYTDTTRAALATLRANVTPLIWGAPGIGKSAMAHLIAAELGLEASIFTGGTAMDDDGAGTPYVHEGRLRHAHRRALREAIEGPRLLVLDEFTAVPEQIHGSMLAIILDRHVGDTALHPDSRVLAIANPPEHAPAAARLSAATANRLVHLTLEPSPLESIKWFAGQRDPILAEFGIIAQYNVELLQMAPTSKALEAGVSWASPRAWDRGLRSYAETNPGWADDRHADLVGYAVLAGSVGEAPAASFLQIRSQRKLLPPYESFLADPKAAMKLVKGDAESQLAALSILPTLAKDDTGAAWLVASKLAKRFRGAAGASLLSRDEVEGRWYQEGMAARLETLANQ